MKKYFVLLPLLLVTVFLTTFAHSTTRNDPRTEQAFSKVFAGAFNVKWAREGRGLSQGVLYLG